MRVFDRVHAAIARATSSGAVIPEIDGLRFIAIAAVVVFHIGGRYFEQPPVPFWQPDGGGITEWFVYAGFFGVQLFFVISGFVLALPFAQAELTAGRPVKLGTYFLRRVTRLHPPYLICLGVCLLSWLFIDRRGSVAEFSKYVEHLIAHAFYVHGFIYGHFGMPGFFSLNNVMWSLEVEVQFYLIAPILATIFRIRRHELRRTIMILTIIGVHTVIALIPREPIAFTIIPSLYYFLLGFLFVDVYLVDWKSKPPSKSYSWDVIGFASWLLIPLMLAQSHFRDLYTMALIFLAYVAAFRGVLLGRFFANRWIVGLGGMCYTIYLYHTLLLGALHEFWNTILFGYDIPTDVSSILVQIAVVGVSVVPPSALLFIAFEKPFMKSRRKQAEQTKTIAS